MIRAWEVLSREEAGDFGLFRVQARRARSPRTGDIRPIKVIEFPDWVMVLPIAPEGEVVMVRQYRHGIERVCLELPGGLVDRQDPSPERTAARELLEETGFDARKYVFLGKCYPQPAVLSNAGYFYLAQDAQVAAPPNLDAGEDIEIVRVPLDQVSGLIDRGEIDHAMVLTAFCCYWRKNDAGAIR